MKKNLDTGEFMPIILSELRTQNSELRTQNSELRIAILSLGGYIKTKGRCVLEKEIFSGHDGLFVFKRNFSECSFFSWGAFRKIPNADFFIRELSEKFQRQTFCLGSVWKNSAGRLSS